MYIKIQLWIGQVSESTDVRITYLPASDVDGQDREPCSDSGGAINDGDLR